MGIGRDWRGRLYLGEALDNIYDYAVQRGFPFKEHCLVWGQQYPSWVLGFDSAGMVPQIEDWFRNVGTRYPKMAFVDVVNEPFPNHTPSPTYYEKALGGDGSTGWDWVIKAFQLAGKYCDTTVKLLLNEYNIINDNSNTDRYIQIINVLKARNLIDGIGVQGHYFELRDAAPSLLKSNLDELAATGLPIYISEYEVDEANDNAQLRKFQQQFTVLWEHPAVKGITLWGYIQNQIWRTNGYLIRADGTERPALQWFRQYLTITDVNEPTGPIPADYMLCQNYPNMFNPSTTIQYSLPRSSKVKVTIYNVLGVKVRTLVDPFQNSGEYSLLWDGRDDQKNPVSSGVYFYRLDAGGKNLQKKMILVR